MKYASGIGKYTVNMSLPSRERGLKYLCNNSGTPLQLVAPFAGAWIEIVKMNKDFRTVLSLPSRERGLKFISLSLEHDQITVAPFAGAWIEI